MIFLAPLLLSIQSLGPPLVLPIVQAWQEEVELGSGPDGPHQKTEIEAKQSQGRYSWVRSLTILMLLSRGGWAPNTTARTRSLSSYCFTENCKVYNRIVSQFAHYWPLTLIERVSRTAIYIRHKMADTLWLWHFSYFCMSCMLNTQLISNISSSLDRWGGFKGKCYSLPPTPWFLLLGFVAVFRSLRTGDR